MTNHLFKLELLNIETVKSFQEFLDPGELKDFFKRAAIELSASQHLMQINYVANDWGSLQALAHRLKGSLGSLGCDQLFAALEQIEDQLRMIPIKLPTNNQMTELQIIITATLFSLKNVEPPNPLDSQ